MTHCGAGYPGLWLKTFGRKNGNSQLCTGHGFLGVGAVHLCCGLALMVAWVTDEQRVSAPLLGTS